MTLSIQNKGNKKLSNDEIFNSIIKKENGVNPFLTIMNFRVSFRTWLKVAREELDGCDGDKKANEKSEKKCPV
jgi:hypothetical protein